MKKVLVAAVAALSVSGAVLAADQAGNANVEIVSAILISEDTQIDFGQIINIVDIHSQRPLKNHPVYGPAKAGLAMLTRSLAKDLAPDIRVNGISPGAILWPEEGMPDSAKESIIKQIPLRRVGEPEDIARTALFLIKDAPYITGQIIAVDGGRSVGW